jgi:2-oxoglutarate dehydrogenase E2 component (dihydrolipoamide succinyltransferase)
MPQMGESIAEGTLTTWYKKEGDHVERDENLFEISTDKVDAEIPSPAEGTLGKILVNEGETVEVGTVVATILQPGEVAGAEAEPEAAAEPRPEVTPEPAPPPPTPEPVAAEAVTVPSEPPERPAGDGRLVSKEELRRARSSPLVRNIAAEHGIDLTQVSGTGLSGRVTKRDILAFVEGGQTVTAPPVPAEPAPTVAPVAPPEPALPTAPMASPSRPPIGVTGGVTPGQPFSDTDRVEIVPMSIMRQKIAEHMIDSRRTSAHVTSFFEFDMTRVAVHHQRAHRRRKGVADRERLGMGRQDRSQEGRQRRHRRGTRTGRRFWAPRPSYPARRRAIAGGIRAGGERPRRSRPHQAVES